ncbi:MAG TPA: hypothetical protein VNV38_10365 [Stellaceae bacterium]|nr:hypothetical protein [Stellaceae bacterium]
MPAACRHYPLAMTGRTLFLLAFPALLALAACQSPETASSAAAAPADLAAWRLASGKMPTQAEYAALTATCEAKGGMTDACFAELGLKKAQ